MNLNNSANLGFDDAAGIDTSSLETSQIPISREVAASTLPVQYVQQPVGGTISDELSEYSNDTSAISDLNKKKARIKKACDSCNTRRTKCDGTSPCGHCVKTNLKCTYLRVEKKRGRASDKYPKIIKKRKDSLRKERINEMRNQSRSVDSVPLVSAFIENTSLVSDVNFISNPRTDILNDTLQTNHPSVIGAQKFNETSPAYFDVYDNNGNANNINGNFDFLSPVGTNDSKNQLEQTQVEDVSNIMISIAQDNQPECQYPVLVPVIPVLNLYGVPIPVACSLLEHYFQDVAPPCLMAPILKKSEFLITEKNSKNRQPRACSPALLLSIIAVALIDMEHPFLSNSSRKSICNKIIENIVLMLPHDKSKGSIDDIVTYIHLGACCPLSSSPVDMIFWFNSGVDCALALKLNKEIHDPDHKVSEIYKDERRRVWWSLYMLDRHGSLSCNKGLSMQDISCLELYHPQSDDLWCDILGAEIPPIENSGAPKGIVYDVIRSGIYGWLLPYCMILGGYHEFRKHGLQGHDCSTYKKQLLEYLYKYEINLQLARNLIPATDYHYACLYSHITKGLINNRTNWEPLERLDNPIDILTSNDQIDWLYGSIEILEIIKKLDPDMRDHPLMSGFYLFVISLEFLSILENINIETINELNIINDNNFFRNSTNYINTLTTSIESLNTTIHTEYLRIIRNYLRDALRDVNRLLLLNDIDQSISKNREKRKMMMAQISYQDGYAGVAVY